MKAKEFEGREGWGRGGRMLSAGFVGSEKDEPLSFATDQSGLNIRVGCTG